MGQVYKCLLVETHRMIRNMILGQYLGDLSGLDLGLKFLKWPFRVSRYTNRSALTRETR